VASNPKLSQIFADVSFGMSCQMVHSTDFRESNPKLWPMNVFARN
jgi:hypothetical protein